MTDQDEGPRILASASSAKRISRRAFLSGSAVVAVSGGYLLSACTSNGGTTPSASGSGGSASPDLGKELDFFHWAQYDDPNVFKKFTQQYGPVTSIDTYDSNEAAITKLVLAQGSSGYDIVVPTGVYIPLMVKNDLIDPLDLSRIPNFSNLDTAYTNQPWDPGNQHSVCKDWGTTGWIVDKSQIQRPIKTWSDFLDVCMHEASGNCSVLAAPNELSGLYFWANGIDWTTENPADLDAYESFIVDQFAPHVKSFESYPGYQFGQGEWALSHVWNGDARQGFNSFKDPSRYEWGLGAPTTELWMDNWCMVKGAPHPDAAYAFMNFILDPTNSLQDMEFHGYNPGIKGIKEAATAAKVTYLDMIFFTPEQLATFKAGAVNTSYDRLTEIFNKAKAAAGG